MRSMVFWAIAGFWGMIAGCQSEEPASVPPKSASGVVPAKTEKTSSVKPERPALPSAPEPDKRLYAKSFINQPAPALVVEEWLTKEPDRAGKMVLIDFWATWCGPCLKTIPKLNQFHRQHKDRLVIIGLSDETSDEVRAHRGPRMNYFVAVDPLRRTYKSLEIENIPHVILIDPTGIVRWEGFPLEAGHELTEKRLEELLDVYVRKP